MKRVRFRKSMMGRKYMLGSGLTQSRLNVYNPNNRTITEPMKDDIIKNKKYLTFHLTGNISKLKILIPNLQYEKPKIKDNLLEGMYWYNMPEYKPDEKLNYPECYIGFLSDNDKKVFLDKLDINITENMRWVHYPNKIITKGDFYQYKITRTINPKYPVYIISKGRWEKRLTSKTLEECSIPYHIVVEKQEYDEYAKVIDPKKILILPDKFIKVETDKFKIRSSIPARNFVWEHAVKSGAKKHWILDDNMNGFFRWNLSYRWKIKSGVLFKLIEDYVDRFNNILQSGMNYSMFYPARDPQPPITFNTRVYSCILNDHRIDKLVDNIRWKNMNFNEDTDLSLRVLKAGYSTALFNAFLCGKEANLTSKGGNTQTQYTIGNDTKNINTKNILLKAQSLVKEHPDVARIVKRFKRGIHHEVNYNKFKNNDLGYKNPNIPKGINNYNMKLVKK
jgi:hypothetical protein